MMPAASPTEADAIAKAVQIGAALHQRGLLDDAEKLYAGVLKLAPDHFDALHLLGVVRQQRGDSAEAARLIEAALEVRADSAEAFDNYGQVLLSLQRLPEALSSFDRALALAPDQLKPRVNRATVLIELDRLPEALVEIECALRLDPSHVKAWIKHGNVLSAQGHHEQAIVSYDRALAIDPALPDALNNRGFCLGALSRAEAALQSYDAALVVRPDYVEALINRGNVLIELQREPGPPGRAEAALQSYDAALAIKPDHVQALINRGNGLAELHRVSEALLSYEQAVAASPKNPDALFNLGITRLRLGDFRRGWDGYEWRWQARDFIGTQRTYPCPRWDGENVEGTLLVSGEQGLGDQIIFASMVPDLISRARSVVVEVEARLVDLFARSFPAVQVVAMERELFPGPVTAHSPMGSLGRILRPSRASFPFRQNGFLVADPARAARLRERLADGRRLIGLSWRSRNPKCETSKSAALRDFAALFRLPRCRFIDLQYGDTGAEREEVEREFGVRVERLPDIDNTQDIDGLAALITACAAVVSVSSTSAGIAGALGKETHVLVPFGHGRIWSWLHEGTDTLWYPRVRLERRRQYQPWAELVTAVVGEMSARRA